MQKQGVITILFLAKEKKHPVPLKGHPNQPKSHLCWQGTPRKRSRGKKRGKTFWNVKKAAQCSNVDHGSAQQPRC